MKPFFQYGKWQTHDIYKLREIYESSNCKDLFQKPVSEVSGSYLRDSGESGVQLDVPAFIWRCIQQALTTVKEADEQLVRNTERVNLVVTFHKKNITRESESFCCN